MCELYCTNKQTCDAAASRTAGIFMHVNNKRWHALAKLLQQAQCKPAGTSSRIPAHSAHAIIQPGRKNTHAQECCSRCRRLCLLVLVLLLIVCTCVLLDTAIGWLLLAVLPPLSVLRAVGECASYPSRCRTISSLPKPSPA